MRQRIWWWRLYLPLSMMSDMVTAPNGTENRELKSIGQPKSICNQYHNYPSSL
jgi:hypothetical protein